MDMDLQARIDSLTETAKQLNDELHHLKHKEYLLQRSERRYRSIFCDAGIGLAEISAQGHFLEVNPALCNLLGYDKNEILGLPYTDIVAVEDHKAEWDLWEKLLSRRLSHVMLEKRCIRKDSATVWVKAHFSVSESGFENGPNILVAIECVNERRELQASLSRIAADLAKTEVIALGGTWEWNVRTGEVFASDEVLQLFGVPAQSKPIPLEAFVTNLHAEDKARLAKAIQLAVAEQKLYQIEYRLSFPDGHERIVSASGEIYQRDADGRPLTLIGIVQDVTVRRQAELALRESERRFRELFESAVDGIFIADVNSVYTDVNASGCALLGFRRDELIGKRIVEFIPEEDKNRLDWVGEEFLRDPAHIQVAEWKLMHKNGCYIPVEISARIIPDGRWMAIVRDIRERKRVQDELTKSAAEIRDIYDNAPCGYHSVSADGTVVQMNRTELDWLGYSPDEVVGKKKFVELLANEDKEKFLDRWEFLKKSGSIRDVQYCFVRKDGTVFPVLLTASATYDDKGNFVKSRTSVFDVTELEKANQKLRQAAAVFEHTNDAIIITDADEKIIAVNKAFSRVTGYTAEEVIGKNPRLLKSERHDKEFYRDLWHSIERTGAWQGEIWDRRKSGEVFPAWQSIVAVKDQSGKITDYISVFSDITTIKEAEKKLISLAYHDALTGLPNRLLFNDRMAQSLARAKRDRRRVALLLLDLDRFKLINDTLGHTAGDALLQIVAARLSGAIREEDTVARLGGDEFAIILSRIEKAEEAAILAEKIISLVALPVHVTNRVLIISTSVGISIYPDDTTDVSALVKCADMAMYAAKRDGKNGYEFYSHEMTATANETLLIDHGLRGAIRANELELRFQPQVDLPEQKIGGVEALVRWNRHGRGLENPAKFIPVAEETDLIESLGDWVLDAACEQLMRWRSAGIPPLRIGVNVSARQLRKPRFVEDMRHRMKMLQPLSGFRLDLEITETALQTNPAAVEILWDLKPLGLKFAIDDFGIGYSSLGSLKHLPVDILKIDRSFIQGIPANNDDKAIAIAIISMGHNLGMSIIAEGIETASQFQFLLEQHCDVGQGFFFYHPLHVEEIWDLLQSGKAMPVPTLGKTHSHSR